MKKLEKYFLFVLLIFPIAAVVLSCAGEISEPDSSYDSRFVTTPLIINKISSGVEEKSDTGESPGFITDIFIYEDDKAARIDTYQRCLSGSDGEVILASRPGPKIMAVIANPWKDEYEWSEISSFEALSGIYAEMGDEPESGKIMSAVHRFTAGAESGGICEVALSGMVSEIRLRSLKCDFSSTSYAGAQMTDVKVYLSGVNTRARLFLWEGFEPEAPVNTEATPEGAVRASEGLFFAEIEGGVGKKTVYPDISLNCYPNECDEDGPGAPYTRLVICGEILGQRYYYPININRGEFAPVQERGGVGRNRSYVFDVVIRRTGSLTPDQPVGPEAVEIGWDVVAWEQSGLNELEY